MQALDLPFDRYERYKIIKEAIGSDRAYTCLDVGGSQGTPRRLLDWAQMVIVDLNAFRSDVCASGRWVS